MNLQEQIEQLLTTRAAALAALMSDISLQVDLETRAQSTAARLVATLADDDEHTVAETVADLVLLAHGDGAIPDDWWTTPLGRVVARSIDADDAEAVSPRAAARMLGVHERRIYQLRDAGKLDRHPDGGVTRASVLARVASVSP